MATCLTASCKRRKRRLRSQKNFIMNESAYLLNPQAKTLAQRMAKRWTRQSLLYRIF